MKLLKASKCHIHGKTVGVTDVFTGVHTCQSLSNNTLKHVQFTVCQLCLKEAVFKDSGTVVHVGMYFIKHPRSMGILIANFMLL